MAWMIALDSLVILLLGAAIFYAWRLERMLRSLDKNRQEMEKFLGVFSSTIARAEKGIRDLQDTAQDSGVEVDRQMARAAALRDELSYLVDTADKIATRLTETSREAIARTPMPPPVIDEPAPPAFIPKEEAFAPLPQEKIVPPWAKRATENHVIINRSEKPAAKPEISATPGLRSETERDLQQALEKIR